MKQVITGIFAVFAPFPTSQIALPVQKFDGGDQPGLEIVPAGKGKLISDMLADALHHLIHFGWREAGVHLAEYQASQMVILLGEERAGIFSQGIDVLRTAGGLAAAHERGSNEPFTAQDVEMVTHSDGSQTQLPAQFAHRRLVAFLEDSQNTLSCSLHGSASFQISVNGVHILAWPP